MGGTAKIDIQLKSTEVEGVFEVSGGPVVWIQ